MKDSPSYVVKQLVHEYTSFTNLLRYKKLTANQLTYLHNTVLIPKVEYRAQCSHVSEPLCHKIQSSFLFLFKHKLQLVLFSQIEYKLLQLYSHLITHNISKLYKILNSPELNSSNFNFIYLLKLRDVMLIPFSPTLITDWSLWNNFKTT